MGRLYFWSNADDRTLNHLDLLAPTLLLRAAGVLPPTKESLEAMGDSTDLLHTRAREEVRGVRCVVTLSAV